MTDINLCPCCSRWVGKSLLVHEDPPDRDRKQDSQNAGSDANQSEDERVYHAYLDALLLEIQDARYGENDARRHQAADSSPGLRDVNLMLVSLPEES